MYVLKKSGKVFARGKTWRYLYRRALKTTPPSGEWVYWITQRAGQGEGGVNSMAANDPPRDLIEIYTRNAGGSIRFQINDTTYEILRKT
jgi:hypothetical protein